jgi:hypothetical protein
VYDKCDEGNGLVITSIVVHCGCHPGKISSTTSEILRFECLDVACVDDSMTKKELAVDAGSRSSILLVLSRFGKISL